MNCNGKTLWNKVSRRHPCPICGKPDWCLTTGPADSPGAVICARIESDRRVGTRGAGWLHRLRNDRHWKPARLRERRITPAPTALAIDFAAITSKCEAALDPLRRGALAAELGVSADSLWQLQVGWSERDNSFTFPMCADDGTIRGVRLRRSDGSKWAVMGSRHGLFIPRHSPVGDSLVVCEGPTDTAAMATLCFEAVGRPSCSGGVALMVDLVKHREFRNVVIVADRDGPGQNGARYLGERLVSYVPDGVRIVTPPAKDARDWVRAGADRLDVLNAIQATPAMILSYSGRPVI